MKTQQIKPSNKWLRLVQNMEDLVVLEVAVYNPLEIALHPSKYRLEICARTQRCRQCINYCG